MTLRYRLFLWIGILFLVAFILSFFVENILTKKELTLSEIKVREELVHRENVHREHIEKFLSLELSEGQARVNSLLQTIADYGIFKDSFAPTIANFEKGNWFDAALLFATNKWLGFLQTTNEGHLTSLVMPKSKNLNPVYEVPIEEGLFWVLMDQDKDKKKAYIGVQLDFEFLFKLSANAFRNLGNELDQGPNLVILFDWLSVLEFSQKKRALMDPLKSDDEVPNEKETAQAVFVKHFLKKMKKANAYLEKELQKAPMANFEEKKEWFNARILDEMISTKSQNFPPSSSDPSKDDNLMLQEISEDFSVQNDQITMVLGLTALFDENLFQSPFEKIGPVGVARVSKDQTCGFGCLTDEIFFSKPFFDDTFYYQQHQTSSSIASSIATIIPPDNERVFLGNTLQLEKFENGIKRIGYLTLGFQLREVFQKLTYVTHQLTFLEHQGKILAGFSDQGVKLPISFGEGLPLKEMALQKDGIAYIEGVPYFFLNLTPFPQVDLHFFMLQSEKEAFALIKTLKKNTHELVGIISLEMRIVAILVLLVGLIMLHRIAKKITKPISSLAKASESVSKGHFEEIKLPPYSTLPKDEIYTLCLSFEEMVKGLKEKEKVRSVLNKVVSQEIAEEILKGQIHLGGEEMKVTILFADIRNFTAMTQKMKPEKVVELLNACLNKISKVIDEHYGVIDKFVGDEVMALFGAPIPRKNNSFEAIMCAKEIMEVLEVWNHERSLNGLQKIEVGIGIHTGIVIAGNMGSENRLNYTVLGSNVNLASRLCSGAPGMQIWISREAYEDVKEKQKIEVEKLLAVHFKGFDDPIEVYVVKFVMK